MELIRYSAAAGQTDLPNPIERRQMRSNTDRLTDKACLIGPQGILSKYRKVNPWIPYEVHASPHGRPGYAEPLFPVVETPIGRIGAAICYDWIFPEAIQKDVQ